MTRETRKYLSRVRKAQDAILNGKNTSEKKASLEVDCSLSCNTNEPLITLYAHLNEHTECVACEAAHIWPWYTAEEIEAQLSKVSQLIGYEI